MAPQLLEQRCMGHDMELGPAGPTTTLPNPADVVALPEPPAQAPAEPLLDLAKTVVPGISNIMKGIETVQGAWKLLKGESPTMSSGPRVDLPATTSKINQIQIDRAFRYAIASAFLGEVMEIGRNVGIDFTTWKYGTPPPEPAAPAKAAPNGAAPAAPKAGAPAQANAPAPAAPAPPQAATPAPAAPAPGAAPAAPAPGAAPAGPAAPAFGKAQPLVDFVNGASLEDLKNRAQLTLLHKIAPTVKHVDLPKWYWNGSNQKGFGEPPKEGEFTKIDLPKLHDPDADGRTYVQIGWHLSIEKIPETELVGMPAEVSHFTAISAEHEPAIGVAWYTGGYCSTLKQEAEGDKIEIQPPHVEFDEGLNAPVGGYHMDFEFMWDRSATDMHCDVTFASLPMIAPPANISAVNGEPKT